MPSCKLCTECARARGGRSVNRRCGAAPTHRDKVSQASPPLITRDRPHVADSARAVIRLILCTTVPPNSFFILARCILGSCTGPRFVILECLTSGGHAVSMALAHGTWLLTTVVGNERVVRGRFDRSVNMTVSSLMRSGSDTVLTYTSEQCRFGFLFRVA